MNKRSEVHDLQQIYNIKECQHKNCFSGHYLTVTLSALSHKISHSNLSPVTPRNQFLLQLTLQNIAAEKQKNRNTQNTKHCSKIATANFIVKLRN